jgi:YidC/Oxa1 family membrane protein insertase
LSCYKGVPGFSVANIYSAAHARIFGVPISASFTSSASYLHHLHGSQTSTRVLCLVLTILMGATTFITQRQLMARNSSSGQSTQMAQQQKILLYVFPLVFLFYGFKFPIGVLLYWLTTNVWSMVQQRVVIQRMQPVDAGPAPIVAGPAPGAKPKPAPRPPKPAPAPAGGDVVLPPGGAISPQPTKRPNSPPRRPNNRSKNRKRGRR